MGLVTAVEEAWLKEMFPGDFTEKRGLDFEENGRSPQPLHAGAGRRLRRRRWGIKEFGIRKAKSGKKLILEKLQAVFTAEAQRTRRNGRGGARPYRSWGEALSTLSGSGPGLVERGG